MARNLPLGRATKEDIPDAVRKSGVYSAFGNKGFYADYFDQIAFEAHQQEHILGSAAQLTAEYATITWNQSLQRFEDWSGSEVVLGDYERITVIGMDTLTADMVIDNVVGLELRHLGGTPGQSGDDPKFKLGDAGGGVPYKIRLGSNTRDCKFDFLTDKDFRNLLNFTYGTSPNNARYIANQGLRNKIAVNGCEIFNFSYAGEIIKLDTFPVNPYLLRMNGQYIPFATGAGVVSETWFRDLNIALGGYRWNGSQFIEAANRFSVSPLSTYLAQVNTANRFFTDISNLDTRIHSRLDMNGVSFPATTQFTIASNIISMADISGLSPGLRINGASARGIPDGSSGTTIIRNVNILTDTAEMYDALTGAAVNATSTGATFCTYDNSGAAGGSRADDALENITGSFAVRKSQSNSPVIINDGTAQLGAYTIISNGSTVLGNELDQVATTSYFDLINFDASNVVKTHNQTQPKSTAVYYYYKV